MLTASKNISQYDAEIPRRVTILGSTGSIGCNTVKLLQLSNMPYSIVALTAHKNVSLLAKQAIALKAERAVIADEELLNALKEALSGSNVKAFAGKQAVIEAASRPVDWVMSSIVGVAGLEPTLAAIRQGTTVALANKECLVSSGELMMEEVASSNAALIPVDSEHNAIFQVLNKRHSDNLDKITLTASGGPFRGWSRKEMAGVTPEQAVKHPNWSMGMKISVDSATMMNKGLECIEAYHLFPVEQEQIDVLVHPESVVHSMVSYRDGSVLAQLGTPDMCTPISYTLAWPERMPTHTKALNLAQIGLLTFEAVDNKAFPALNLSYHAMKQGGAMPAVLNATNEIAVAAFLAKKIRFLDIVGVVEAVLAKTTLSAPKTISDVIDIDTQARSIAIDIIDKQKASFFIKKAELLSA